MKSAAGFGILLFLIVFSCVVSGANDTWTNITPSALGSVCVHNQIKAWADIWDEPTGTTEWSGGFAGTCYWSKYGTSYSGKWARINRGWIAFNTTVLPQGYNASSTKISFTFTSPHWDYGEDELYVYSANFGDATNPTLEEFDDFGDPGGWILHGYDHTLTGDVDFPTSGINWGGWTVLSFRLYREGENVEPTWQNNKYNMISITTATIKVYGNNETSFPTPTPTPTITPTPTPTPLVDNFEVIVSGLNTSAIPDATVAISYAGGSDGDTTDSDGSAVFTVPANRMVSGTVNKDGYQESVFQQYAPTWPVWVPVVLYTDNETPGTGEAYGNLILTLSNKDTLQPITNTPVFVKIYTDGGYASLFESGTTYTGTYNALLPLNTTYYFKVSAALYSDLYFSTSISEATYLTKYMSSINPGSDIDGDGIPDMWDPDIDGDEITNDIDTDDDGDGTPDSSDESPGGGTQQVLQPTIHIWAYSTTGTPISGALVTVTSDIDSGSTITSTNGTSYYFCADIIQGESRWYNVTVHHGAYVDQSSEFSVSTSNPSVTFYMTPGSGVITPTATGTYVVPTTPAWSGPNGSPGNAQEFIFNYTIGTFGLSFTASGMLLGLIICIVCACLVGGFSNSGMGAMIGGGFGWLAAGVMGYIPAWAIIVSVAIVVMAFFVMRGSGSED